MVSVIDLVVVSSLAVTTMVITVVVPLCVIAVVQGSRFRTEQ